MASLPGSMTSLPIEPLDGTGGYQRAHAFGVAHVLFEARLLAGQVHRVRVRGRFRPSGDVLLEQAHIEALGVTAKVPDDFVAHKLCGKLPEVVSNTVVMRSGPHNEMTMRWSGMSLGVSWARGQWRRTRTSLEDDDGDG
jgi:hypothetical protein